MDAKGWCRATRNRRAPAVSVNVPVAAGGQQDRRQAGARAGGRVLPARVRAGGRDCGRTRRRRRRSARRDHRAHARTGARRAARRRAGGNRGRHRRPAERRQVVAAQPVAARGALDRQRDAGDDEGYGGCGAEMAAPDVPDRRYRGHPAGGARGAQRAARVAERDRRAAGDRARRMSRCW